MQFNTTTIYALQIMLCLTQNRRIVSSSELSDTLSISQRYIINIAGRLRVGGLIVTKNGMGGGYSLLKESSQISAFDIIKLMEDGINIPDCISEVVNIGSSLQCTLSLLIDYMETYLRSMTIDRLVDKNVNDWQNEFTELVKQHINSLKLRDKAGQ